MKIPLLFLTMFLLSAFANSECDNLKTPDDVLKCIVSKHIDVSTKKSEINEISFGIDAAEQRVNPELEAEAVKNKGTGFTSEVSLMHTFELGGKRSARIKIAESEQRLAKLELLSTQEKLILQTVLDLYRLRQINHETDIVNEIIATFKKITRQYLKAGRLNPEDKMSASIFKMALEENKLKKNSLINEKQGILARMESGIERKLNLTPNLLPKIKRSWGVISSGELGGYQVKEAQGKLDLARANHNLQKSDSWSNLTIGPKVEFDKGDKNETRFGIALSIPLPLFQTNGGGKAKAMARVKRRELQMRYTRSRLQREKDYLKSVYDRVSKTITKTLSNKQIMLKHKNLHKMTNRGVVSAPIVIELHRQIMDYYEKLHEQEIQGIQALWRIAALEGRILKEKLQ